MTNNRLAGNKPHWRRWISVGFGIYSALLTAFYVVFMLVYSPGSSQFTIDALENIFSAVSFSALAFLLTYHRPGNKIGWLLIVVAILRHTAFANDVASVILENGSDPGVGLLFWKHFWNRAAGLAYSLFAYLFVLFPDGKLPSPRWRLARWLIILQGALTTGMIAYATSVLIRGFAATGPTGGELPESVASLFPLENVEYADQIRQVSIASVWLMATAIIALSLILAGFGSQVVRFRRGRTVERQQVKWAIFATAVWAVALFPFLLVNEISTILSPVLFPLLPAAIAIPILRYRLYDIDLIIRRTALYGLLSVALALIYFGSVTLLQSVFGVVVGQESPVVIVLSTLLIAALFSPFRRRVQRFIDRRFYRRKYNAQETQARFARAARDEVDLNNLSAELAGVIQKTLQPESLSIWLRPGSVAGKEKKQISRDYKSPTT